MYIQTTQNNIVISAQIQVNFIRNTQLLTKPQILETHKQIMVTQVVSYHQQFKKPVKHNSVLSASEDGRLGFSNMLDRIKTYTSK